MNQSVAYAPSCHTMSSDSVCFTLSDRGEKNRADGYKVLINNVADKTFLFLVFVSGTYNR